MEVSDESLRNLYGEYSDEALLEATALGPEAYSPQAWHILHEILTHRGLDTAPAPAPLASAATSQGNRPATEVARKDRDADSEGRPALPAKGLRPAHFFLWNRLTAGGRWPPDEPLPLNGLSWIAVAAWIAGGLFLLFGVIGMLGVGPVAAAHLNPALSTAFGIWNLAFARSTDYRPSPGTWWAAVIYVLLTDAALISVGTVQSSPLRIGALMAWLLYFARRRAMYGLRPWLWAL